MLMLWLKCRKAERTGQDRTEITATVLYWSCPQTEISSHLQYTIHRLAYRRVVIYTLFLLKKKTLLQYIPTTVALHFPFFTNPLAALLLSNLPQTAYTASIYVANQNSHVHSWAPPFSISLLLLDE